MTGSFARTPEGVRMFSSKSAHDLNHDESPWVFPDGTRWDFPSFDNVELQHRPRPEFDHVQHNPSNPILVKMRAWGLSPADVLWAIDKGAGKRNDKRSKRLQAAAQIGGAQLKPYEGEWEIHRARTREGRLLSDALDHTRVVVSRLVSASRTQP